MSNYATKTDLNADTSSFAKKTVLANLNSDVDNLDIDRLKDIQTNLNNLKSKIDKLDIGKLEITPVVLSELSNVVKNNVVKKTEYTELVKKGNDISSTDTSILIKKY